MFGMTYKPATIALVPFPYSDLSGQKQRPVLILKEPDPYGDVLCLAITSQTHSLSVMIDPRDLDSGSLKRKSWVRIDKLFTLNSQIFVKELAVVKPHIFNRVTRAVCNYLGCLDIKETLEAKTEL
jgi:mRNA interferase MazF